MSRRYLTPWLLLGAVIVLAVGHDAPADDERIMRIHRPHETLDLNLADIDSITFHVVPSGESSMVFVPAGEFVMGDGSAICGVNERLVTLTRDFWIGRTEVTTREYVARLQWAYERGYVLVSPQGDAVLDNVSGVQETLVELGDVHCEIAFDGVNGGFYVRGGKYEHPVIEVTWYGAAAFCNWTSLQQGLEPAYDHDSWACNGGDPYGAEGYRLPTDAEWEYAAQYDDERIYPSGNAVPDCSIANFRPGSFCVGWTSPVGSYPPAPASLGLLDMAANNIERCNDWFECDLGTSPATDPVGPASGVRRVLRGGQWDGGAHLLRCAYRHRGVPEGADENIGFRIAITARL
jgi:formylglycine-generating enzyme required for sulfatase activity